MIDVFTPPYDQDRASRALYYKIESSTYEGREGVYEVISSSNTRN